MEVDIYVMSVLYLEHHIVVKGKKFTDGTNSI